MVKKDRSHFLNKADLLIMLPQVYQTCFQSQLSATQFLTLEILIWLLQAYKQVRIERLGQDYQTLGSLGLAPGMKMYLTGVKVTKQKGFGNFNIAAYWQRKYRGTLATEGWYILTNLESLSAALKVYQARSGIEAMFKDCKTGGYNLEGSQADESRLMSLVLIIAISYTCALLCGRKMKNIGLQKYISRLTELGRVPRRHSSFWVGLYGYMWVAGMEFLSAQVSQFWQLTPNGT